LTIPGHVTTGGRTKTPARSAALQGETIDPSGTVVHVHLFPL
jgi:hypothetical protein